MVFSGTNCTYTASSTLAGRRGKLCLILSSLKFVCTGHGAGIDVMSVRTGLTESQRLAYFFYRALRSSAIASS